MDSESAENEYFVAICLSDAFVLLFMMTIFRL